MARCVGRSLTFTCLTCESTQTGFYWMYADEYDRDKNTPFPSTCGNTECPDPQPVYIPKNSSLATVRAEQRCAVYMLPDGDYMCPETNDPNSESAQIARTVGVRREFGSLAELRQFQKDRASQFEAEIQRDIDEGRYDEATMPSYQQIQKVLYEKSRNQVLEYTEQSLREGRDRIRETIAERRDISLKAVERFKDQMKKGSGYRVGRGEDNQRYEQLRGRR